MTESMTALRADYRRRAGRSLAMPIAGALVWSVVAVAGATLPERIATYVLLFGSGTMFPLALTLARPLGENPMENENPLGRLMGMSVLMVNLLWAVHVSAVLVAPELFPLTLGIGLGLHWIVFSWVIDHPVGIAHALLRTVLVTAAWWAFPEARLAAVAVGVVLCYALSIALLARRPAPSEASSA